MVMTVMSVSIYPIKYSEDEIKFDIKKIKLVTLDIEVQSEMGFPDPESCAEEMLLITIQDYSYQGDYYVG